MKRRHILKFGAMAAASAALRGRAWAQTPQARRCRQVPSRRRRATLVRARRRPPTSDPDIVIVDPAFGGLVQANTPIKRLWTGALWSEGPAWSGQGRYLVWSDIPNNRQLRWSEDDERVTVFRHPANNSNGNTFDFQGRQISCEHLTRRVVRYEHDGSITILCDTLQRQAVQLAERRRRASRRQLLVHRSAVRRPVVRRAGRRRGRTDEPDRQDQSAPRSTAGSRADETRAAHWRLSRRREADKSRSSSPKNKWPIPTASRFRPTTRSCMS